MAVNAVTVRTVKRTYVNGCSGEMEVSRDNVTDKQKKKPNHLRLVTIDEALPVEVVKLNKVVKSEDSEVKLTKDEEEAAWKNAIEKYRNQEFTRESDREEQALKQKELAKQNLEWEQKIVEAHNRIAEKERLEEAENKLWQSKIEEGRKQKFTREADNWIYAINHKNDKFNEQMEIAKQPNSESSKWIAAVESKKAKQVLEEVVEKAAEPVVDLKQSIGKKIFRGLKKLFPKKI